MKKILFGVFLFSVSAIAIGENEHLPDDLTFEALRDILADNYQAHEARPLGVPGGYDWASRPKMGRGNTPPPGFGAATGWGQIFYSKANPPVTTRTMFVRQFQTLICETISGGIRWHKVQSGQIEGRQFRADFMGNINKPALIFNKTDAHAEISFEIGEAFHFWPEKGRFSLPSPSICGILVVLQARQDAGQVGSLLVGLGADYWTTKAAPWDNYKTNKDIAIGRLRFVGETWKWVGLTTANTEALRILAKDGFAATGIKN